MGDGGFVGAGVALLVGSNVIILMEGKSRFIWMSNSRMSISSMIPLPSFVGRKKRRKSSSVESRLRDDDSDNPRCPWFSEL